jgi:hypothetical protein
MSEIMAKKYKVFRYHRSTISLFKSGKRPVSWPLAEELAEIFPEKTIQQWKQATPAELRHAFAKLQKIHKKEVA